MSLPVPAGITGLLHLQRTSFVNLHLVEVVSYQGMLYMLSHVLSHLPSDDF